MLFTSAFPVSQAITQRHFTVVPSVHYRDYLLYLAGLVVTFIYSPYHRSSTKYLIRWLFIKLHLPLLCSHRFTIRVLAVEKESQLPIDVYSASWHQPFSASSIATSLSETPPKHTSADWLRLLYSVDVDNSLISSSETAGCQPLRLASHCRMGNGSISYKQRKSCG